MSVFHFSPASHLLRPPTSCSFLSGLYSPGLPAALRHKLAGKQITFVINIRHYQLSLFSRSVGKTCRL